MTRSRIVVDVALLAWMGLAVALYLLVTMPADGPLAAVLPDFVMRMRDIVFPFFFSKSVLS